MCTRKATTAKQGVQNNHASHSPSRSRARTSKSAVAHEISTTAKYVDLVCAQHDPLELVLLGEVGPRVLSPELARYGRVLALPRKPLAFGTVGKLFSDIRDTLKAHAEFADEGADLLSFSVIATWFPEYVPVAPSVVISGPAIEAQQLLRVLRCVCRHALLVADLTPAALVSPVMQLSPTLLLDQPYMNQRLMRLLSVSSSAGSVILGRGEPRTLFCSKFIATDDRPLLPRLNRIAVHVAVCPTTRPSRLNDAILQRIEDKFQNRLLAYRLAVRDRVAVSDFDLPSLGTEMRLVARTFGACIVADAELQGKILDLLTGQDTENRIASDSEMRCLVIEAALFHVRERKKERIYVGEIAQTVRDLLRCRNEHTNLDDRAVGQQLKDLGFRKRRDSRGYSISCNRETAEFVEDLARKYQVVSAVVDNVHSANGASSVNLAQ